MCTASKAKIVLVAFKIVSLEFGLAVSADPMRIRSRAAARDQRNKYVEFGNINNRASRVAVLVLPTPDSFWILAPSNYAQGV